MEDHHQFSFSISTGPNQQISQAQSKVSTQQISQNQYSQLNLFPNSSIQKFHQDKALYYFKMIFSPKQMAQSIKRRNENLQMLNFQNSDQQPDDIFNRRKKKVIDLITKQGQQLQVLLQIKKEDQGKFIEIIGLLKFLTQLKEKLNGARTEYYSNKTFCALKNSSQIQINVLTKTMIRMYNNIIKETQYKDSQSQSTSQVSNQYNQRINQFLILPRFLISREKIIRFCKNQVLQRNLQFLISHKCLGHYNNQANKKMPEETQMVYVRNLLGKKFGRQKFKRICSINHGNKFLKSHGKAYYQLYQKSMEYLKQLDTYLKKGKKYQSVIKQLQKISQNDQISLNENESAGSLFNFKTFDVCLSKMQKSNSQQQANSQMKDELIQINLDKQVQMNKIDLKRMLSLPQSQKKHEQKQKGFFVKKYQSMNNAKTTQNIILIPPPFNYEA